MKVYERCDGSQLELRAKTEKEEAVLSHNAIAVDEATAPGMPDQAYPENSSRSPLLGHILKFLDDEKAENIVSIDLDGKSDMADFMVIASGRSNKQVVSISEKLVESLKKKLKWAIKVEGKAKGDWVLIDAGDVIVHVFRPEVREFYQLEKLWMS